MPAAGPRSATSACASSASIRTSDGTQAAADALLQGGGKWDEVWRRFCDAPQALSRRLGSACARRARATSSASSTIRAGRDSTKSRKTSCARRSKRRSSLPHAQACEKIVALDDEHKERRGWVWAQLGESPYAVALEPLGRLARAARTALGGATAEAMAADYAAEGWRCDRAAMEALLAASKPGPRDDLVTKVVRALYEPWLDRSARRFQELLSAPGVDPAKLRPPVEPRARHLRAFRRRPALRCRRVAAGAAGSAGLPGADGPPHRADSRPSPRRQSRSPRRRTAACAGKADAEDFAPAIAASGQPQRRHDFATPWRARVSRFSTRTRRRWRWRRGRRLDRDRQAGRAGTLSRRAARPPDRPGDRCARRTASRRC